MSNGNTLKEHKARSHGKPSQALLLKFRHAELVKKKISVISLYGSGRKLDFLPLVLTAFTNQKLAVLEWGIP